MQNLIIGDSPMDTNALATTESTIEDQELETIQRKMKFTGTVIKTTLAGAVIDIGLGVPGVVHISQLTGRAGKSRRRCAAARATG